MRIIAGAHKGRRIPFNNKRFGNARVTSDFVKEAVFGSLGVDLVGKRLLDLFAGSGQIGLEAVSRGATAWMNDRDKKRASFIRDLVTEWQLEASVTLTTDDWRKLLGRLEGQDRFDLVYVDPPYDARTPSDVFLSEACLTTISESSVLSPGGRLYVQHDRRTELPEAVGNLMCFKRRRYGDSLLSTYEIQQSSGQSDDATH
jgi:16S rRNA (guanine966-N2)-methyltransferase